MPRFQRSTEMNNNDKRDSASQARLGGLYERGTLGWCRDATKKGGERTSPSSYTARRDTATTVIIVLGEAFHPTRLPLSTFLVRDVRFSLHSSEQRQKQRMCLFVKAGERERGGVVNHPRQTINFHFVHKMLPRSSLGCGSFSNQCYLKKKARKKKNGDYIEHCLLHVGYK